MSLQLLFLGTGTSAGIPIIGCDCAVCHSSDPRDHRDRPSVVVRYDDPEREDFTRQFIIDTTPEMRLQIIRHGIKRIDGVMYTHPHADHIFGLDDLRRFNAVQDRAIDIYGDAHTLDRLRHTFGYIFESHKNLNQSFVATLIANEVTANQPYELFGATWTPLELLHGRLPIVGYRVDYKGHSLAYCTDISAVPPGTYPLLEGLDVLVIDALRFRHHPTHLTVDQALDIVAQVRPGRAYLTHMAHEICHAELEAELPEHVYLAFDGLTVSCQAEKSLD